MIGREARRVEREEAFEYVAGSLVENDVSVRDLQHGDGQWVRERGLDSFAPVGPELVTADEVSDPHDLDIWTEVDGERLQDSSTSNRISGVGELVSSCSRAFTLDPGARLFTGTPPGVGLHRDPPVLLENGDGVAIGIEGRGELTNTRAYRSISGPASSEHSVRDRSGGYAGRGTGLRHARVPIGSTGRGPTEKPACRSRAYAVVRGRTEAAVGGASFARRGR